jgi:hypothetical protein
MGRRAKVELVLDCADPKGLAAFWREALDHRDHYMDARLDVHAPKEGIDPPLLLQGVPESKAGKNRIHLDIAVDNIEAEIRRLQALGAHRSDEVFLMTAALGMQQWRDSVGASWSGGFNLLAFLFAPTDTAPIRMLDSRGSRRQRCSS